MLALAARMLHNAPLPPWPGGSLDQIASHPDAECEWLVTNGVLPADLVTRNRGIAEAALRPAPLREIAPPRKPLGA